MAIKNLGRVVGLSAYETWLAQGNDGTEEDFLATLKGEKGDKGEIGPQGPQGEQGPEGRGAQADWNQNDETQPDYIKNRICYEESTITEVTILTEAERNLEWNGGDVGDWSYVFTDDEYSTLMSVLEGKTEVDFAMTIDDSEYVSSYYKDENGSWRTSTQWILDGTIAMSLALNIGTNSAYIEGVPMACKISSGIHTVSLKSTNENVTITKIPEKFLPESALIQSDYSQNDETANDYIKNRPFYDEIEEIVLFEESERDFNVESGDSVIMHSYIFTDEEKAKVDEIFQEYVEYTLNIKFDGTNYTAVYALHPPNEYIDNKYLGRVSNELMGFEFNLDSIDLVQMFISGGVHTVGINVIKTNAVKIPEKFIPDTIATKAYVDEKFNSIVNANEVSY